MFCVILSMGMTGLNGCDYDPLGCYGVTLAILGIPPNFLFLSKLPVATPQAKLEVMPRLTGSDGSTTGVASFLGNFTGITQPSQTYFLMKRQPDCSLNLITGTSSLTSTATYTGNTANFERNLHQLASLKTTGGVYPGGCAEKSSGISSRPGVWVGNTTGKVGVLAMVAARASNNAVWTLTYSSDFSNVVLHLESSLTSAGSVATSDLNGDGNGDLVVVNSYGAPASASIAVMLGKADGSFNAPATYATAGPKAIAAVIDDVNGDGKLDVVVASSDQQISVLTGKGDGTLNAAVSFAAPLPGSASPSATPIVNLITADLRGIGRKDIVASNGLVLLGNGDGTFTAAATVAFPYTAGSTSEGPNLASGDLNKDGKLDLVLNDGDKVTTWLGKADGTFTRGNGYAAIDTTGFVTVSDLDGDGNLDIYTGLANGGWYSGDDDSPGKAYVLMGNGDGSFQGAPASVGAYTGKNLGDVNGDGRPDLITPTAGTFSGRVPPFTVQVGTANGSFNPVSTIAPPASFIYASRTYSTVGAAVNTFAVGDMNGDGKADLVFLLTGVQTPDGLPFVFTAMSNGDGTFAAPVVQPLGTLAPAGSFDNSPTVDGVQIADFDGNGRADLIFTFTNQPVAPPPTSTSSVTQGFAVVLGNGDGTFGAPILTTNYSGSSQPSYFIAAEVAKVADLNGDGRQDLMVVARTGSAAAGFGSQLQVYLGKGDGTFNAPTAVSTASNPRVPSSAVPSAPFTLADLNGDGKPDLVCLGETPASQAHFAVSLGKGDGTFATPTILNVSGGDAIINSGMAVADFDGDAKLDLALLNPNSLSGIFYGKGDGTFTSVTNGTNAVPKDLINIAASGPAVALDLNGDGKQDLLVGSTLLLNIYGSAPNVLTSTTTTLTASATRVVSGGSVKLTATIAGLGGSPSGTVTFLDGSDVLGTGTLTAGVATYTTTTLGVGDHSITAVYAGDTVFSGSTSGIVTVTVTVVPVVGTTTALAASTISPAVGTNVALTATVAAVSGVVVPGGVVTFLDGTATLGTGGLDGTGKATFSTNTLAVGSHSITARYGGAVAFSGSTSSAVTVTVVVTAPDFSVAISPGSGTETKTAPTTATLTVTPLNGLTGTVSFACTGLPTTVVCGFAPATVTIAGSPVTTTVTFSASASAMVRRTSLALAAFCLGAWLIGRRKKGLVQGVWAMVMMAGLVSLSGCGGGAASPGTNPVTSTVNVTATAGGSSHTVTFTLTSQ